MSAPTPAIAAALTALPASIRKTMKAALHEQCKGDWTRVRINPDGSFTVRNGAPPAARRRPPKPTTLPSSPPAKRAVVEGAASAPAAPAPESRRPPSASKTRGRCSHTSDEGKRCPVLVAEPGMRCSVHDGSLTGKKAPHPIEPGVNVQLTRSADVEEAWRNRGGKVITQGEKFVSVPDPAALLHDHHDWENIDIEPVAAQLRTLFRHGYPVKARPVTYYPDVLALYGIDLEERADGPHVPSVEAALEEPDHVEVRPESKAKGYPILGFWRGDVLAVLGMKKPSSPQVIAAYYMSHSMHDVHRPANHTGGGGARKVAGLPKTAKATITQLRALGCEIEWDEFDTKPVTVKYQGKDLGKISTAPHTKRDTAEADYQRSLRRMQAIRRKGEAVSA